jgi:hypothetical protein
VIFPNRLNARTRGHWPLLRGRQEAFSVVEKPLGLVPGTHVRHLIRVSCCSQGSLPLLEHQISEIRTNDDPILKEKEEIQNTYCKEFALARTWLLAHND